MPYASDTAVFTFDLMMANGEGVSYKGDPQAGLLIWGAPFPGTHAFESRMYIAHVFLLPILIGTLMAIRSGGELAGMASTAVAGGVAVAMAPVELGSGNRADHCRVIT